MHDIVLVLRHLVDWRFFTMLAALIAVGVLAPARYLKPFRSVRFNIWLFTVIASVSVLGTFFPDADLYHSWWFSALLALMAFDVVACKLRSLPAVARDPFKKKQKERTVEQMFADSGIRATISVRAPAEEAGAEVRAWLRAGGFHFRESGVRAADSRGGTGFFAARHRLQRWGDFVLHVSIVVILAGALMGALFGFDEVLAIPEGATMAMKNRPFEVTLEDFDIQYYASTGAARRYASQIVLRRDGTEIARKRIVVNDPLDVERVRFYQASFGFMPEFRSAVLRLGSHDVVVRPGETVPLMGDQLAVRAHRILPTFEVDPDGKPRTADYEGRNPALLVDFIENGKVRVSVWLLFNRPEAYRVEGDRVVAAPPPPFRWVALDPILFSGVQIGYDPGAPLFWFGAIFLMAGLCSHFYLHQRRLRVAVVATPAGSEVWLGGWSSRAAREFEPEFERWVGELRRKLT